MNDFNPMDCNKLYFKELLLLLNVIHPEKFKTVKRKNILNLAKKLNIHCGYDFINCNTDEFFLENKKQIVIGRFYDTIGCYYSCRSHYFIMEMDPYTVFKNDIFIRYIIDKPEIYINNSKKVELEDVFPVRIILNHEIPTYAEKKLDKLEEYVNDPFTHKKATSKHNLKIINALPESSLIKQYATKSNVVTRELCLLYSMKLNFYKCTDKPFILVSKYNLQQVKNAFNLNNKPMPKIEYLYKKNKTVKYK
jgi:hypothetical protein